MFGVLKVLFYTFVAVVVGVFLGTVPVGGQTIAERVAGFYPAKPPKPAKPPARAAPHPARVEPPPAHPAGHKPTRGPTGLAEAPTSAGAANAPDGHSADEKKALDRLIATRTKAR
jgi:hypothetical protein